MTRISLRAAVGAAAAVSALAAPASAQSYYDDIRPILVQNCMGCHSEAGISWSMENAERTYERAARIARAIDTRRMPPFLAEPGHQEYVGDLSLDEATLALVRRWAENGYAKGDPRPDPEPAATSAMAHHSAFEPTLSLDVIPGGEYLPNQERSDDYRCFLVDWTEESASFITGFRAVPGNTNVAHHVVIYSVEPEMWERYKELDAEEEGPGYQCFGGALPDRLGSPQVRAAYEARYPDGLREMSRANFWLAHWAPGMDGHVFPEGTGIRMKPGSGLVVQMHYYASTAPGEADAGTRMDFITADAVERPAFHLAQTRGDWLVASRNETMVIPAGEQRTYEVRNRLSDLGGLMAAMTGVAPQRIAGVRIHSANVHMHSFGHSGEVVLTHASGEAETLLRIPRWDLGWQRDFAFVSPKRVARDELESTFLTVRCTFENDTAGPVVGGYGSMDEMCFNFSYIAVEEGEPARTTQTGSGSRSGGR
jgi:hypothetical protein